MSASNVVEFIPAAVDHGLIPVCVSPDVCIVPFLRALAAAGLTYRHDVGRKIVIIEPDGAAAEEDARAGMAVYNGWSLAQRLHWHQVAGSAVAADAVAAFRMAAKRPHQCPHCGGTGFDEDAACEFCDASGREEP